jgi:hypothetical protein
MRRTLFACVAGAALAAPAAASADVMETYQDLAERRLSPAPLVPTTVPRSLSPLDRTVSGSGSRRRGGYALRLVHYGGAGPDAVIALEGGGFGTIRAALRDDTRRLGFKAVRTRVRGHRGYLLTRHLGPTQRELLWAEGGRVYQLGSGTPKKVSLKDLRATAAGLDRLERDYIGTGGDPDLGDGAIVVTTARTVTADVSWGANCMLPGGFEGTPHAGSAHPTLLARQGDRFSFDIAQHRVGTDPWAGSVSGTIGPDAIVLTMQASGPFDGGSCDTGPLSYTLEVGPALTGQSPNVQT